MTHLSVSSLHLYPVKSLGGVDVARAQVVERGFAHDRRWMVVDPDGRLITQRSHPKLALIQARLDEPKGEPRRLRLEPPGVPPLVLPAALDEGPQMHADETHADETQVEVWASRCVALDAGDEASGWFSEYLGESCRLVYMPETTHRPVDQNHGEPDDLVSFADGFPFLLIEQASLEDLNSRLDEPVPMNRFRPNIVVSGAEPFAADHWRRIRIGEVEFRVAKPCARCVMTTIDQATGRKTREPLRTLASYRRRDNEVLFGQNLIQDGGGVVRVGDSVEVLS